MPSMAAPNPRPLRLRGLGVWGRLGACAAGLLLAMALGGPAAAASAARPADAFPCAGAPAESAGSRPARRPASASCWTRRADRAARLEALTVQGWLQACVPTTRAPSARAHAGQPGRAGGGARRATGPARLADKTGNTKRAMTLIDEAMARLPADAPTLTRLRFVDAQARIRTSADKLEDAIRLGHEALGSPTPGATPGARPRCAASWRGTTSSPSSSPAQAA